MATVQKGSKINFYKFVSPPAGGSSKEEVDAKERSKVNKVQVEALNNLGGTVNGIASILVDLKTIRLEDLEEQRKNRDKFKPEFIKKKKKVTRRQDRKDYFQVNGAIYSASVKWFKTNKTFYYSNTIAYVMPD